MKLNSSIDYFNRLAIRLWHVTPNLSFDPMRPERGKPIKRGQLLRLAQTVRPSGHGVALAVKTYSSETLIGYIPDEFRRKIIALMTLCFTHVTVYEFHDGFCRVRIRFYPRATPKPVTVPARLPYAD